MLASAARQPARVMTQITRRQLLLSAGSMAVARRPVFSQSRKVDSKADGAALARATTLLDFEPMARARLSNMVYEYVAGGAGSEVTLRSNTESWDHIRLRSRVMVDVSHIDTRVRFFGRELPHPVVLAPTSYHRMIHPEGELGTVRGAGQVGAVLVAASFATTGIEDMARAASTPLWFQLYVQRDRGFTRNLVQKAEAAGCAALCLTVDQSVRGYRDRDSRASFTLPAGLERVNMKGLNAAVSTASTLPSENGIYSPMFDPTLSWKDIDWLRGFIKVPLLVKGVMTPEDADASAKAGVDGLIVSNHGGRSLDTLPSTAEVLPAIAEKVAGRIPLLVDGGIRRGTDVLKGIALGASAVLIGRPYVYGLAVGGADGVRRVVEILLTEFKMAMALSGVTRIGMINRSTLWNSTKP
jgi:4-hydroxymandelate oxidase